MDILLITPPFIQPNAPYPATPYLKGYLSGRGIAVEQADLSIELLDKIFSRSFLTDLLENYNGEGDDNCDRIYALRRHYIRTIDPVMKFLRGQDNTLSTQICSTGYLPCASRFETVVDTESVFGQLGTIDCAKYLATLYLQDISDFVRATVSEQFEIVKYGEQLAMSIAEFATIEQELFKPMNQIELQMCELLRSKIEQFDPRTIGFTIPFPGNLLATLRMSQYIRTNYPQIKIAVGGGYPTTELRNLTDRNIFTYVDYVVLDDGERALEQIVKGEEPANTFTVEGFNSAKATITHHERGCPDYGSLPHNLYFSLTEVTNPMHRLWSDGRWNKLTLSHGCYWGKCAFCDTSLDYIARYDSLDAATVVDYMEQTAAKTGSSGFHFTDEAAPPKLLKELSLEILRRGDSFTWWTNIRFEKSYTGDLCRLLAEAGCVAVSGGLEVADDKLLAMIGKGITIEQATMAMRNFYYAGIMVHTYLMYGLPTENLQQTVDALEVVRQMFRANLIDSAFWHRYAMTIHSESGIDPEKFGVRRKGKMLNTFANNELFFADNRGYNINLVGDGLVDSLSAYMMGEGLERPVHKWFAMKAPQTSVEPTLITDCLIKPDLCRIYNPQARIVWIGGDVATSEQGVVIAAKGEDKEIKFDAETAEFIAAITEQCGDLSEKYTFEQIEQLYNSNFDKPFIELYSSKKWDILRSYGLLQI